ncbi:hypothetical protein [Cohaesibacter celericrescens]|uniref:Flagellar protein FliL n=1 Tax=Cohaesibacter celericrescens TaxID=2067669 RepID=A0A2N5XLW5_9HYPH|nr:hypothetical protein [Cohaesibacter celericrescens]PLW75509.1 hypothetical protein C0081_19410 [Cohaesibacter celericrescens]PLW78916.1 hypothetical protein C0081_01370 [Cohaesibacter celericrescens]
MRYILLGFWIGAVAILSAYFSGLWMNKQNLIEIAETPQNTGMDYEETRAISVPMIADGKVHGYVVAQFVFTIEVEALQSLSVPPNPYIIDEAFRAIFNDPDINFSDLRKYDLDGLTQRIKDNVNARMKGDLVHDILVEEFSFFPKSMAHAG